jgi:hypothetical protein
MGSFSFLTPEVLINWDFSRNKKFTLLVRYVLLVITTTILKFSDGEEFDLSGPLRKEHRIDADVCQSQYKVLICLFIILSRLRY